MNLIESYTDYDDQEFDRFEYVSKEVAETIFSDCTFKACDFHETEFVNCRFNECKFVDCNLNLIKIEDCTFREVSFESCKIVGVNWLVAQWPKAGLNSKSPISFSKCQLDYSTFIGLHLPKIKFIQCSLKDIEFSDANLEGGDFANSILSLSRFNNSNLRQCNFEGAKDYKIDLLRNKILNAKFSLPEAYTLIHHVEEIILIDETVS